MCVTDSRYVSCYLKFVNVTLAIFLTAEFGFLGLVVVTFVQTPLLNGDIYLVTLLVKELYPLLKAWVFDFLVLFVLPFLTN